MYGKRIWKIVSLTAIIGGMLVAFGCGDAERDDSAQQLTGSLSMDSDGDAAELIAVDEEGTAYLFETDDDGNFRLALPAGQAYELYVREEASQGLDVASQIVFPRADGGVDHQVSIEGTMAPFEVGELRPEESLDAASYEVVSSESQTSGCEEGPEGLYCVHDGVHPGCQGLETASEARKNAERGLQIADEARQAAEADVELVEQAVSEAEDGADNGDDVDSDRPVALPQINPPFEFPGCDLPAGRP